MQTPTSTRAHTANIAPFGLRMQPELRALLEAAAAANGRSLNAEIAARLVESFEKTQGIEESQIDRLAEKLADKLTKKLSVKGK